MLSVRSFTQRIAHVENQLVRHDIAFEFIFEHDANTLDPQLLEQRFAPSDLSRAHQSLVLKHMEVWTRAVAAQHKRVLVFEDDVVLASNFNEVFGRAMDEADALTPGWSLYLGRGDNFHVGQANAATTLIAGGLLPAADALVCDLAAARKRLDYLQSHRITRPADWLIRETDAAVGISHYWLAEPIVEQGSMNGVFTSVLDDKRRARGRLYNWLRYRWDKLWRGLRYARRRRPGSAG